jgi:phage terminase large subunit-like protein
VKKPSNSSTASLLRKLPPAERKKILRKLRPEAIAALRYAWPFWGRPEQFAPGTPGAAIERADWSFWLLLAGRGFGKTRAGAEWAIAKARALPGSHGALVAATVDDARKTMLSSGLEQSEGASGILAISPPDFAPMFEPSKRTLAWPNGTVATIYSAEEPDRLRGPQHHWGWVDEIAAWQKEAEAWDQLLFGLRLGDHPQACITTTPRPIRIIRELLVDPRTVVTRGTTYDNRDNLAPSFLSKIAGKYEGTRFGRQELYAELLDDVPGALWSWERIEALRVQVAPELRRIVVAIDPAVSSSETSDETGLVVAGVGPCRCRGEEELHGFVLEDLSGKYTPNGWGQKAVMAYHSHQADRIVAETNNGGALVEMNLRTVDERIPYTAIHAAQGKRTRAEPIAALYEQGKIHHVGIHARLEEQMTTWDPITCSKSPDRLDALVWALTELILEEEDTCAKQWARVDTDRMVEEFEAWRPLGSPRPFYPF